MFSLEERGRQIGEKLFTLLTLNQKKELIEYISEIRLAGTDINEESYNTVLLNTRMTLTEVREKDLYICLEQRIVKVRSQVINLTVKEFDLLALLMMHPKRVFTYEMLMDLIWHEDYAFYSRKAVNNHVSNLRKKIKIAPDSPDYVKSVYGVGYKFEV